MNKIIQLGNIMQSPEGFENPQTGRIYSIKGIAPTLNTCGGGMREPKVIVPLDDYNLESEEKSDGQNNLVRQCDAD